MSIVRWRPLFPVAFRDWTPRGWFWSDIDDFTLFPTFHDWPSMDVYSEKDDMVVKMELPEFKADDVSIDLHDSTLTISGRHEREEKVEDKNYYRRERVAGSFTRSVPLPGEVKEEDISASLKNGVLEIRIKGAGKSIEGRKKIPIASS